ncbi:hypothetical protein [Photobacterium minamisatsumaniensis]|uniref:hypothetical protein n=1 Tax=Photobacterium minamisatsumaniensis TaxID=2910233 RepID=UPI003D102DC1
MTNNFISKALVGITLSILLILLLGAGSAFLTNERYTFTSEYEKLGSEKLLMSYKRGRAKIQFYGYNKQKKLHISKQFFGYFLRFGSHYLLIATEQDTADTKKLFTTRSFFIKSLGENAFIISDQRGVFITKEGKVLHLNSILKGKRGYVLTSTSIQE